MDVEKQTKAAKSKRTVMDIGALLVESRENKNLTAQDIATHLNLTLSVITKIEANEFKQDIPLPFIRGYLCSYAKKVNADVETLSVEFDRQTKTAEEPIQKIQVVSSFKSSRKEMNSSSFLFKLFTFLIVISLLGFAGWEAWKKFGEPRFNPKPASNEIELNQLSINQSDLQPLATDSADLNSLEQNSAEQYSQATANDADNIVSEDSAAELSDNNIEQSLSSGSSNSANNSLNNNQASSGVNSMELNLNAIFTFTDKCWVQVIDASGETLAVGEKVAGKVMPLEGVAPFTVILGNPAAVSLTVNGEKYDLSVFRPGRRANFVLTSLQQ